MNENIFIDFIENTALLLSLGLVYDVLYRRKRVALPVLNKIASGLIIGGIAVILMAAPIKWESGIIFDTRTILLGLTGLFFGAIPTFLAIATAGLYRLNLGGGGAPMGVATIISSGLLGLAWRHYRFRGLKELSLSELYLFGMVVHAVMILCIFLLPEEIIQKTIGAIALPVMLIYPLCTALLGNLLTGRQRRHRIEEELQDSTLRFNQLAEQSRTVTWEVDAAGLYIYVSEMAEPVFGLKPEELVGKMHFYDIHPLEGREEFKLTALEVFERKGEFDDFANPVQGMDGKIVWVSTYGIPILAEDGSLLGYRGSDKDITGRKLADEALLVLKDKLQEQYEELQLNEESLREQNDELQVTEEMLRRQVYDYETSQKLLKESEERLRIIFETSESGIILVSPQGVIDFANRRMAEIFGMPLQELIGSSYPDHLHESEKQVGDERMRQLMKGEIQSVTLDRRYIRMDGTGFWGHLSGRRLQNPDGSFRALVGIISDVSELKKAEEDRLQLQQQLHQAQKLESLGILAGGIAHDFNNILTVIMGQCYMGREYMLSNEEYKTIFRQIENAGNRAADLCRQMLTYAGRAESVRSRFSLRLLLEEVVKLLQSAIKKNVTIELDLKPDIPEIYGDIGQVQQILMNLIINAAEAIDDDNGTIRVLLEKIIIAEDQTEADRFGTVISAGSYALLEVTDTGCGMEEETEKRIFEPFYTTKFTGRGLGMSAICGIIKSHNATLQLTTKPGVGTTFKVCFPVALSIGGPEIAETEQRLYRQAGGTILLVEDEETIRNIGAVLLEALGFSALTAEHGREAVEIFRERGGEIDVILLDLIMPVMGGVEAYRELRKITPATPIIICSGYDVEQVSEVLENDEQAGFLQKPYNPDELREMMMRMLDRS
ncbi:MAG: PAS domain S-box protein [Desulfuromonadaceae bacterium]|nr:PAS domain S-box protein [Desulfuromonadaceae bacterium]